jgi:transcriptional regulator with XRE-family HTH domain
MPDYSDNKGHQRLKKNIEAQLKKKNWYWSNLQRRADVSSSMISNVSNLKSSPTLAMLLKLAGTLGVPVSKLLEGV